MRIFTISENFQNWQVRKAEKGKDYGWLDFLSLPKMKLPNFLGFNSDKEKAPRAEKEGEQVTVSHCTSAQPISLSKQHPSEEKYFTGRSWEKKNLEKASTDSRLFPNCPHFSPKFKLKKSFFRLAGLLYKNT